jgi:hypothetical protein
MASSFALVSAHGLIWPGAASYTKAADAAKANARIG